MAFSVLGGWLWDLTHLPIAGFAPVAVCALVIVALSSTVRHAAINRQQRDSGIGVACGSFCAPEPRMTIGRKLVSSGFLLRAIVASVFVLLGLQMRARRLILIAPYGSSFRFRPAAASIRSAAFSRRSSAKSGASPSSSRTVPAPAAMSARRWRRRLRPTATP